MFSTLCAIATIGSFATPTLAAGIVGADPCTQGPSYWCASELNALECNFTDPEVNCQEYCNELVETPFCSDILIAPAPEASPISGSNPCTWGPSYWCASEENAEECQLDNPQDECQQYCTDLDDSPFCEPLVGSNPCTWGPSYWCASEANALECGFKNPTEDCQKYCVDGNNSILCR